MQKFTTDGEFIESWGAYGTGEGQFNAPWGIAFDSEGAVYVSDWATTASRNLRPTVISSNNCPAPEQRRLRRTASTIPPGCALTPRG